MASSSSPSLGGAWLGRPSLPRASLCPPGRCLATPIGCSPSLMGTSSPYRSGAVKSALPPQRAVRPRMRSPRDAGLGAAAMVTSRAAAPFGARRQGWPAGSAGSPPNPVGRGLDLGKSRGKAALAGESARKTDPIRIADRSQAGAGFSSLIGSRWRSRPSSFGPSMPWIAALDRGPGSLPLLGGAAPLKAAALAAPPGPPPSLRSPPLASFPPGPCSRRRV